MKSRPWLLQHADFARSNMHPLRCEQCEDIIAYSHWFSSDRFYCTRCTSPHPKPSAQCSHLEAAARLLRFALKQENLFLATAFVHASRIHKHIAERSGPSVDLDLSQLEITL